MYAQKNIKIKKLDHASIFNLFWFAEQQKPKCFYVRCFIRLRFFSPIFSFTHKTDHSSLYQNDQTRCQTLRVFQIPKPQELKWKTKTKNYYEPATHAPHSSYTYSVCLFIFAKAKYKKVDLTLSLCVNNLWNIYSIKRSLEHWLWHIATRTL